mgnify:CR=1 FL=1
MKTDGYIFTPELLQWRYFHRPVVVQVLIHVLLSSAHNEASAATLSYRDLALQLHTTVKAIRVAIDVLIAEKIITKCSAPRASTKLYVNSSHPLSHCIHPWQRDQGAQITAHFGAQIGAQSRAQIPTIQQSDNQGSKVHRQAEKGTDEGTVKGTKGAQSRAQPKQGAQPRAQSRAQISHSEPPLNKGDSEDLSKTKGTDKDIAKGTEVREKKQIKENLSPETPIKENKQRKEKAHPQTQKKEKEKKSGDAETHFSEVLRLFNRLFLGTQVKPISKMTPDRKKLVAKFISDYSFEDIEPMLRKALDSDLLSGRKDGGCYISFNWLFNPKNYEPLMEGTFDNPSVEASAGKKSIPKPTGSPKPQQAETSEEIEARLKQKEEAQKAKEKAETDALRQKYQEWIEGAAKNPNGSMAKMVRQAYDNGTLAKLGIVWNPSVAEEEQSLADLDDQTQSYLKSILRD